MAALRIGIDLGGSKTEGIALDEAGTVLFRDRRPTPAGDYSGIITLIADLVAEIEHITDLRGTVGIGIPGAISHGTGLVKNANSTCLIGHPLKHDVERRLERTVRIANDADCFALSEATDGAGRGYGAVFGVILGTGVGGGLVMAGALHDGPNRIAGEWGHNPLPWPQATESPGPACYCGKKGCIETFLSGPGLTADHHARTGRHCMPAEIADAAASGALAETRTLEIYADRCARALSTVINIVDPDAIVLGGGLSNMEQLYRDIPRRLPQFVFSDDVRTLILRPQHGDSSGVRGAAWLWPTSSR